MSIGGNPAYGHFFWGEAMKEEKKEKDPGAEIKIPEHAETERDLE